MTSTVSSGAHIVGNAIESVESAALTSISSVEAVAAAAVKASWRIVRESIETTADVVEGAVGEQLRRAIANGSHFASVGRAHALATEQIAVDAVKQQVLWMADHAAISVPTVGLGILLIPPVTRGFLMRVIFG